MKILVDELPWCPSECVFYDSSEGKFNVDNSTCSLKYKQRCEYLEEANKVKEESK